MWQPMWHCDRLPAQQKIEVMEKSEVAPADFPATKKLARQLDFTAVGGSQPPPPPPATTT
ncbi:hypothetical protein OSB04_015345 [Centaurea solstitialis]|uniref:Uncharacterized protein n=1 Tax=Centaurea solstitialis TaxID=347529 RepID=A0AA38WGG4_9ASTR|nr:hypothetical protein OSB04_015345 [Centaurea solstitialis]